MTRLDASTRVYVGQTAAQSVYVGDTRVWPPPTTGSGEPVPTTDLPGWRLVATEDFTVDAALGQFPTKYPAWTNYDGLTDTSGNGTYSTAKTVTVHDSVLDMYVHTENGQPYTASPTPPIAAGKWDQLYGRYAVRFRTDAIPGYKMAWLLWPEAPKGWVDGEVDFPEADLGGTIAGYAHQVDGDPAINQYAFSTSASTTDWHTAVIEWSPGKLRFLLDGAQVGVTTDSRAVPHVSHYWVLQTETQLGGGKPSAASVGHVYVDWTAVWSYNP